MSVFDFLLWLNRQWGAFTIDTIANYYVSIHLSTDRPQNHINILKLTMQKDGINPDLFSWETVQIAYTNQYVIALTYTCYQ